MALFDAPADYEQWLVSFAEAYVKHPVEIYAYCLMPNHFHLVVRPNKDGQLAEFMRVATMTHSLRWHQQRQSFGTGAVYQGRYRASPIQTERYFLNACRYVEGNAVRARLALRVEDWPWSSFWARCRNCHILPLTEWPILQPQDWIEMVNSQWPGIDHIRSATARNAPIGDPGWAAQTGQALRLRGAGRRGRPPIVKKAPGGI